MKFFSTSDLQLIKSKGISPEDIQSQIHRFKEGFPFVRLERAATAGDGIEILRESQIHQLADSFKQTLADYDLLRFVPASGAATRMFKSIFAVMEQLNAGKPLNINKPVDKDQQSVSTTLKNIKLFAFYPALQDCMKRDGLNIEDCLSSKNYLPILQYLVTDKGLNYGNLPKALLTFHAYQDHSRTAFEEHLADAAAGLSHEGSKTQLHFTLSPEHEAAVKKLFSKTKSGLQQAWNTQFKVSWSFQKPSTDTIAVDMENKAFRDNKGQLVFRPAGHGALLQNLNETDAELVFIKNIDNVVPDHLRQNVVLYNQALAGFLLAHVEKIHGNMLLLDDANLEDDELRAMASYASDELGLMIPEYFITLDKMEKIDLLYECFNRPVRVCGMVPNAGEPGGGPFWVYNPEEGESLQIVESAQVDLSDPDQKRIFESSTHFNPVDLVCYVRDFNGDAFDLNDFSDPETGFISIKSKDGRELKAMELPGLWNGAMAHWITLFVEVPISTFNPVKEINDLLRDGHR